MTVLERLTTIYSRCLERINFQNYERLVVLLVTLDCNYNGLHFFEELSYLISVIH